MNKNIKKLVKRQIFNAIAEHTSKEEITVIIGPRQVGKTTILLQLKEYLLLNGFFDKEIFIFNLDVFTDKELFASQESFIEFIKERAGEKKIFVFVDEAQRVENAGIFFKGVYDLKMPVKLFLTGSSALEIKSKIQEPLTGRKRIFHLYPFTFREYLSHWDPNLANIYQSDGAVSRYSQKEIMKYLSSFLVWGGYPKIALEENIFLRQDFAKEIYSSYIEKDIVGFLKIKNQSAFVKLVSLLASQSGQLVNIGEISRILAVERKTIEKYLDILEKTFIIKTVRPFFKNHRKELIKMAKVYFIDNGLRHMAVGQFNDFDSRFDRGQVLENFVFSEISKYSDGQLFFWRTKDKAEVDFVLADSAGTILPIEVKAAALKAPEFTRSFRSFLNIYNPKKALIVNMGFQGKIILGTTEVNFILPHEIEKAVKVFE